MNLKLTLKSLLVASILAFTGPHFAALADDPGMPNEYRIKIDEVDMSDAPVVRLHTTFLDKKSHPIDPKNVIMEIIADDDHLNIKPKVTVFRDSDRPLDLAFVIPITERFSQNDLDVIKKGFSHIIEQARKQDRIAGFFDDGRAINVAPLGDPKAVDELLSSTKPQAQPSFLYSSLDKALEEITDPANMRPGARRAIILVTDAFDTYTYRSEEVQQLIFNYFREAKEHDVHIYVIMYQPFIASLLPLFEGLSRKTGATFRYVRHIDSINERIQDAWGEIYAQTILEFKHPGLRAGQNVVYAVEATKDSINVKSLPYKEVKADQLKFNWMLFGIVCGIIAGILIVALIVFLIYRSHKKKQEEMEAAIEEQKIQEEIERGERCPKCRRSMDKGWKECLFCAREAAEELNKARAESREKALAEAEKKGVKLEGRVCKVCGRTMMPQWKECLFCKAGIGGEGGPKAGVAPMKDRNKKKEEPKGKICPVCNREMKPHWTTCLWCEADAANLPATAPKKEPEQKSAQDNVRICPDCGRPMKAHWTECLYCEANRMKY